MSEVGIFALGAVTAWYAISIAVRLPRLWLWFKWNVWKDLSYARGYREGVTHGMEVERQWRHHS